MKKAAKLIALIAIFASIAAVPFLAHAGSKSTSDCVQPTAKPTPRGMVETVNPGPPPDVVWVDSSRNEVGARGPHGFFRLDGNRPEFYGYNTESGVNGFIDPTGPHPVCISAEGNKVQPL